jgi:hypothetical protein
LDKYRLWGVLEPRSITAETEENEAGLITSFEMKEVHALIIGFPGLPWNVVKRLANTAYSTHFYINGDEYVSPSEIAKSNETGEYFYTTITVERIACEKEHDCDDIVTYYPPLECDVIDCPEFIPVQVFVNEVLVETAESGQVVNITCGGGPSDCDDAYVQNSDLTYEQDVPCGDTLVLEDITVNLIVNGVLTDTEIVPAAVDHTFNIIL